MNKREFQFATSKIIKTVKRTVTVMIAGIAIGIAEATAIDVPCMPDLRYSDSLTSVIVGSNSGSDNLAIEKLLQSSAHSRVAMLEGSILTHGKVKMNDYQLEMWNDIKKQASTIPFNKVFAQFDPGSESFYIAYCFSSGHRLEATTYADEEDTDVYFTIRSGNKVIFQNVLPRHEFFERATLTWRQISENGD